jgi:hypothetical protein
MNILRFIWRHPRLLLLVLSLIVVWRVLALGHLTYGDIPYFDVATSKINFLYAWGSEQLGTPVRQSLNTVRDVGLLFVSPINIIYYLLKYVAPILIIPQLYFWIFSRLGIRSKPVLLLGSIFPLFTPIVFGDFLTGQTFWIYMTLPLVFFYAIKIFALKQFSLRNDILLALWLFLSLGMLPPIIVPLMAVVAIFATAMLLAHTTRDTWRVILMRYIVSGLRIGLIFSLMALPYVLIASSGQAAYTSPSLLGDYYHNYSETHLFNTLRMAGNNGSGQSTLGYNDWSVTNLFGYVLTLVMIGGGIVLGLQRKVSRYWATVIGLLAVLLIVLGFMQLLTINTLFGTRVFESQWLVSTVRNPSKLYAILLPIFVFLFTFGLGNLLRRYGTAWWRYYGILAAVSIAMLVYGWPALRGDLGLLAGREEALTSYRQDPVVQQIAKSASAQKGRALLLPANHRDELNYEFLNPNFNLLRLEGSMPGSTRTIDALNDALNERNPYFFQYLNSIGVKTIFVKKSDNAYKQALFDLFSVRLSPKQTHDFLTQKLRLIKETADYWEFDNPVANELVFSPNNLTYIKDARSDENNVPYYGKDSAVITNVFGQQINSATVIQAKDSLKETETIRSGKAQLHDPSLVLADLYRDGSDAVFNLLSPVDGTFERSIRIPLSRDGSVVSLGESDFIITPQKQRVTLHAGDYRALVSRLDSITLKGSDTSFEASSSWKPGNATPRAARKASIYAASNPDATAGKQSLELGSESHKAFINLPLPKLDSDYRYALQFDYKNLRGNAPAFNIYQGNESILPAEGGLADEKQWQRQIVFFSPRERSKDEIQFFYYTEGTEGDPSENLIDQVRLYRVGRGSVTPVTIPSSPPDYSLTNYRLPKLLNQSQGKNLITGGSFENKALWGPAGDATSGAKGKAEIGMNHSPDNSDGKYSLELRSHNHTAYVSRRMSRFVPNAVYKLSFDYKHVMGRQAAFAIWQDGAAVAKPSGELKAGPGWTRYETYFVPDPQATDMTLYFYARSNGEQTINLYDNVRLETSSLVSTYLSKVDAPKQSPASIVQSYERINPTTVKVRAQPGNGMLVLNESFHEGWQATINGRVISSHQIVNGFANGWWIDDSYAKEAGGKKEYEIVLKYEPQTKLYLGLGVMGATLFSVIVYLALSSWLQRRRSS